MLSFVSRQHWKRNSFLLLMGSFTITRLLWGGAGGVSNTRLLHAWRAAASSILLQASSEWCRESLRWLPPRNQVMAPPHEWLPWYLRGRVLSAQPWEASPPSPVLWFSLLQWGLYLSPGVSGYPLYLLFLFFFCIVPFTSFFIGVEFLCNVVLISVVQRSELVLCIHISPPSWTSLPPLSPTHRGHHGALSWAPCAPQQVLTSSLFCTW